MSAEREAERRAVEVTQAAREILAAQYQRDDHKRAESILMGFRDKRAVDAVETALSRGAAFHRQHAEKRVTSLMREIAGPLPKGVLNGECWILHRIADAIERGGHIGDER